MRVTDLMTKSVASIRAGAPLSNAAKLMWDCDCGAIPVLEDHGDRVIGMVTDRDICMATWSKDSAPSALRVADAMSRKLHACGMADTLAMAEDLMRKHQIRRVPIIDAEQRLVGILSLADIARQADQSQTQKTRELQPTEIASTLADICQSSHPTSRAFSRI